MTVTIISRPTGTAEEESKYPTITGFKPIASYNWLDVPSPTILVPGYPPIWSPPTYPPTITPDDSSFRYVDQNADRYPKCPISPLFSSIQHVQPNYSFSTIDIISDRSPLRKLYAFAAGEPNLKDFRFGVNVFWYEKNKGGKNGEEKKTVVFHRMEKTTREEYDEGQFHGYRAGFEEQYLCHDDLAKGGTSHYRISEYQFGGLKFLLRSGIDGSIPPTTSTNQKNIETSDSTNPAPKIQQNQPLEKARKGKQKSEEESAANSNTDTLSIIPTPNNVPDHSTLLELITRSKNSKTPFDIATKFPDLYLSQTAKFIEAYHHNPRWREYAPEARPARFAGADIHVRNLSEELKDWENGNGEVLTRYLLVLKKILEVVRGDGKGKGKRVWEVRFDGEENGGGLLITEVGGVGAGAGIEVIREEISRFFGEEEEEGGVATI
ncbi:MAG: hypothetical protein Q9221_008074 [Calogaya cf. arnoldii]